MNWDLRYNPQQVLCFVGILWMRRLSQVRHSQIPQNIEVGNGLSSRPESRISLPRADAENIKSIFRQIISEIHIRSSKVGIQE